jgi:hypothetical protein
MNWPNREAELTAQRNEARLDCECLKQQNKRLRRENEAFAKVMLALCVFVAFETFTIAALLLH